MDAVLAEQLPDTWDSFPLFQILNDYLRMAGMSLFSNLHWMFGIIIFIWRVADNLKNGRFHQHLRDTFAPQVVRYVDLMESSIAQSIHKGFEKEKWEIKGWWKRADFDTWKRDLIKIDCLFKQKRLFHIRGSLLEIGRSSVIHSRFALARCRVCPPFGTATETHGLWHDRILHSEVLSIAEHQFFLHWENLKKKKNLFGYKERKTRSSSGWRRESHSIRRITCCRLNSAPWST